MHRGPAVPGFHYAAAVAFTAFAVLLRWLLDPWLGDTLSLATLYGAVALSVWLGGLRPALLTTALGYLACDWLFIAPRDSFKLSVSGFVGLSLYLLSCAAIVTFGEGMRRNREEVHRLLARITAERDDTARAEAALRQADRRKDEFLATLAHELRNPLGPLRTAVEIFRVKEPADPALRTARDIIDRQVRQMTRLVDDLLDVARITQGKIHLRTERVDLAAAVHDAVEAARPLIEASSHQLTVALPPEPVPLDADPTRLSQIILNLLNNAAKYTPPGGHIHLSADCEGDEVLVSVRDDGIGIAAEHLPHVFEMFSQVVPALERAEGGLGIGLSLVRGLVELHGGGIEARSAGPGQGSEFIARLPLAEPLAAPAPEPGPALPHARRVLVVDDNRDAADSLAMMLELTGHTVHLAYDGLEAVEAAQAFRPDVVLLDIGLPKMNGYEAARQIRREPWGKTMALVALTGWGQEEDKRRAAEAGFDHHLTKPVDIAHLGTVLAGFPEDRLAP